MSSASTRSAAASTIGRWPVADNGRSLFWAGLNKGKRSIQIDLRSPEGQRAGRSARSRARAPTGGIFLTNFPVRGELAYDALKARRDDVIMVALTGNPDGVERSRLHGQRRHRLPRTSPDRAALPSRSTACFPPGTSRSGEHGGGRSACGRASSRPHRARIAGQAWRSPTSRSRRSPISAAWRRPNSAPSASKDGNYLYGAFGRDFVTSRRQARHGRGADRTGSGRRCGRRPASTRQRWLAADGRRPRYGRRALRGARRPSPRCSRPGSRRASFAEVKPIFDGHRSLVGALPDLPPACWRRTRELRPANPLFADGRAARRRHLLHAGHPRSTSAPSRACRRCPAPTARRSIPTTILADVLGLGAHEIGRLHAQIAADRLTRAPRRGRCHCLNAARGAPTARRTAHDQRVGNEIRCAGRSLWPPSRSSSSCAAVRPISSTSRSISVIGAGIEQWRGRCGRRRSATYRRDANALLLDGAQHADQDAVAAGDDGGRPVGAAAAGRWPRGSRNRPTGSASGSGRRGTGSPRLSKASTKPRTRSRPGRMSRPAVMIAMRRWPSSIR